MRNWFKRVFQVTYICASPQITACSDAGGSVWNIQGNVFKADSISHAKSTMWRRHGLCLRDKQHVRASVRSPRLLGFERALVEVSVISWQNMSVTAQTDVTHMSFTGASDIKPGHLNTKARNRLSELRKSLLPAEDEQGQGMCWN